MRTGVGDAVFDNQRSAASHILATQCLTWGRLRCSRPNELAMRKSILLVLVVLLVFMPRCWLFNDCYFDEDCDDDNPCTKDICDWTYVGSVPYEFSWCTADYSYYCRHIDECKSGEASTPMLDGGAL